MSAATKAKMAAAAKERWAKRKGWNKPEAKPAIVVATVKEVPEVKTTVKPAKAAKPNGVGPGKQVFVPKIRQRSSPFAGIHHCYEFVNYVAINHRIRHIVQHLQ